MTTTLTSELTDEGIKLAFPDGQSAGVLRYTSGAIRPWAWYEWSTKTAVTQRHTREAAEFDALAWASDR